MTGFFQVLWMEMYVFTTVNLSIKLAVVRTYHLFRTFSTKIAMFMCFSSVHQFANTNYRRSKMMSSFNLDELYQVDTYR